MFIIMSDVYVVWTLVWTMYIFIFTYMLYLNKYSYLALASQTWFYIIGPIVEHWSKPWYKKTRWKPGLNHLILFGLLNNKPYLNIMAICISCWVYFWFDFIECFTTTFLRAHSWLNWVDEDDDEDEVGLKEKPEDTRYIKKITSK